MKLVTVFRKQAVYVIAYIALLLISDISNAQKIGTPQAGPLRPNLGTASTYAIFTGGGAINNTGLSVLTGDVGQDGAYSFNGFPPGTYTGTLNRNNGASALAKSDLMTAQTTTAAVACDFVLGVGIVDGQSFDPGVYCSGGATTTTGNVTFDAHGDATAIFLVKIGGALGVNSGTHILLANNAQASNIYWFVDGAVDVADNSTFKGTIVANGAITFHGTSSLDGRALVAPAGAINIAASNMGFFGSGTINGITISHPFQGDTIRGGTQNYQITWTGTGIGSTKTIEYSLDSGLTWRSVGTATGDVFSYNWNVPDTASKKAKVRITDQNNLRGISGLFIIGSSKITVTRPFAGEIITGGTQNYVITWTGAGLAPEKTIEYSLDGGLTWKTIGTTNSDVSSYFWHVPDTLSTLAVIRVTDKNGITGKSGVFTIRHSLPAPGTIAIIRPAFGESIVAGTQNYVIMWTGARITTIKTLSLSLDEGQTWTTIGTTSNDGFTYSWNVPDTASTDAMIRIVDENGVTGYSGVFNITRSIPNPGSIVVTHPVLNEVIDGGTRNFLITFTSTNTTPVKKFEYSLDGGMNWSLIGFMNSDAQEFIWDVVPNVATTNALIRITDASGVVGTSDFFTISIRPDIGTINSLTLSGLNSKNNIGNNKLLGISWTYTPDIGTSIEVEYTLDFMATWHHIATVPVSELSSTTWMTPVAGFYNPVFIRVTSSLGMTRTSIAFSIGSTASVSYEASKDGYAVSNYPNPAADMTMINVVLPAASDVSLTVIDALGRNVASIASQRYNAGNYNIPLNTSALGSGMYSYILRAGSTTLVGKMQIAK